VTSSGTPYTPSSGTGVSMSACVQNSSSSYTRFYSLALYAGTTLLANSAVEDAIPAGTAKGWRTINFASAPTLSATPYYFAWQASSANVRMFYDNGGSYDSNYSSASYGTWNNPISWTAMVGERRFYGLYCTYTPSASYDISNSPSSVDFGIVANSTTYWSKGSAPSNPIQDGECTFTLTNNAASACDIDVHSHSFTGGVGWTLGTPAENTARLSIGLSGTDPASALVLTTSDQELKDNLAASGTLKYDVKLETPTSVTDGTQKSTTITFTARAHS
jgi:hypothetical protein